LMTAIFVLLRKTPQNHAGEFAAWAFGKLWNVSLSLFSAGVYETLGKFSRLPP
jgi:hypothetical protein